MTDDIAAQHLRRLRALLAAPPAARAAGDAAEAEGGDASPFAPKRRERRYERPPRKRRRRNPFKRVGALLPRGSGRADLFRHAHDLKRIDDALREQIGSPWAEHIRLASIRPDGVAILHVDSSAWAQRARFLQGEALDALRGMGIEARKTAIRVRPPPFDAPSPPAPPTTPSSRAAQTVAAAARATAGALGAALGRLAQTLHSAR